MFFFDPCIRLACRRHSGMLAQWRLPEHGRQIFQNVHRPRARRGARVARALLDFHGLQDVAWNAAAVF